MYQWVMIQYYPYSTTLKNVGRPGKEHPSGKDPGLTIICYVAFVLFHFAMLVHVNYYANSVKNVYINDKNR